MKTLHRKHAKLQKESVFKAKIQLHEYTTHTAAASTSTNDHSCDLARPGQCFSNTGQKETGPGISAPSCSTLSWPDNAAGEKVDRARSQLGRSTMEPRGVAGGGWKLETQIRNRALTMRCLHSL